MRFLIDQGLSPEVARELRALAHDAVHVMEIGFEAAGDDMILAHATANDRIVVTSDLDYAELASQSSAATACVILFRMQRLKPAVVVARIRTLVEGNSERLVAGAIVSVDAVRHRISSRGDRGNVPR